MSLTLEEKIARRGENVSDQAVCELALYAGHILLESGAELFRAGANAAITGDMLTTTGTGIAGDRAMFAQLGYEI